MLFFCSRLSSDSLLSCISAEMLSVSEEASTQHYNFIIVGGGIAGVTCAETVSCFVEYCVGPVLLSIFF